MFVVQIHAAHVVAGIVKADQVAQELVAVATSGKWEKGAGALTRQVAL